MQLCDIVKIGHISSEPLESRDRRVKVETSLCDIANFCHDKPKQAQFCKLLINDMHYNISKLLLRAWHWVALTSWKGGVSSSIVKACSFLFF